MESKYFKCPYCEYEKVEIVLASYTCDKCKKRTSVYDIKGSKLYIKVRP